MAGPYQLTIFLALVLSGLGIYVYFIEIPTTQQEVERQSQFQQLLPFDDRDITIVKMDTPTETIKLAKDQRGRWHIIEPLKARADSREVGKILRPLTLGKIARIIKEENSETKQYGLSPPQLTFTLATENQTTRVSLGNHDPISSTLYARKDSDGKVVLTTLDPRAFFNKSLHTFRLKTIMHFDRTLADRVHLQYDNQEFVLHRTSGIHGLTHNWRFQSPIDAPADRTTIGILLMSLEDMSAVGFIDKDEDKKTVLQSYGKPKVSITIHAGKRDHTVRLFHPQDRQEVVAMTTPKLPLYRIDPHFLEGVTKSLFELRDKRLLGIGTDDLTILSVQTPNENYVLINQNKEWVLENDPSIPLNQELVMLFVSRVVDLPAEIRISEKEIARDQKFGFQNPSVKITAIDRKGRESGRLILGKIDRGLVYAKGTGLPGIFQTRSNFLTQIPRKEDLVTR